MEPIPTTRTKFPTGIRVYGYADGIRLNIGDAVYMLSHEAAVQLADRLVDNTEKPPAKKKPKKKEAG